MENEYLYVLVHDFCDWEDMVVCHTLEEAIPLSVKNPGGRVEVFAKQKGSSNDCYYPTYRYWQRGSLVDSSRNIPGTFSEEKGPLK